MPATTCWACERRLPHDHRGRDWSRCPHDPTGLESAGCCADQLRAEVADLRDRMALRRALDGGCPDYPPPSVYDAAREVLAKGRRYPGGWTWWWPDTEEV